LAWARISITTGISLHCWNALSVFSAYCVERSLSGHGSDRIPPVRLNLFQNKDSRILETNRYQSKKYIKYGNCGMRTIYRFATQLNRANVKWMNV
jgi:hypothetical protein